MTLETQWPIIVKLILMVEYSLADVCKTLCTEGTSEKCSMLTKVSPYTVVLHLSGPLEREQLQLLIELTLINSNLFLWYLKLCLRKYFRATEIVKKKNTEKMESDTVLLKRARGQVLNKNRNDHELSVSQPTSEVLAILGSWVQNLLVNWMSVCWQTCTHS